MAEYIPISREPLNVCAVFIKEESEEECLETVENINIRVKIQRGYSADNEDSQPTSFGSNARPPNCPKTYSCEICTKEFSQKRYMTAHRHRHPEYKDLVVKLQEEKLRIEQAKKEQQFICLYCQKEFCNRSTVNRHMKIHTDEKPAKDFICDICQKAFAQKRDVRVHLRVHTGEKPYKCNQCCRRFSQLASLQYHVQGHSKIKPYPCDRCHKQFLRRISLERHKRIHSGDRPFKCQLCEKAFTQKRHLVQHNRLHTKYKNGKRSKFRRHEDSFGANAIAT